MSSRPRLIDHCDLSTPITDFFLRNPSQPGLSVLRASFLLKSSLCEPAFSYLFLRDVHDCRGKVTRGGKDVVTLKASTFVLTALVCFSQC